MLISNSLLAYQLLPYLRSRCPELAVADFLHAEQEHRHGGFPRVAIEHQGLIDLHVTTSEHLRRWMLERGADPARVTACTINIDAGYWAPDTALRTRVRAELGLDETTPLVLFVGRLSGEKRPLVAVEALARLVERGLRFVAVIAGDGDDLPAVRSAVRRHRLEGQVRLAGAVRHNRVRELMAAADLLILPSAREGIAVTLFEALAMEVVPVAADVGGQRELVTPDCGLLLPPGSGAEAYADALGELIADPERRAQMGAAGRTRVLAHFSAPAMLDRMQALLDEATCLHRESPRPRVDPLLGLPAASLAIEHHQLEQRLRALPPARLLLRLRHSSLARLAPLLRRPLALQGRLDRAIYVARRELLWRAKHLLRRPDNP
jgi:glycosyltransferase involved in cell wall biosynthesis